MWSAQQTLPRAEGPCGPEKTLDLPLTPGVHTHSRGHRCTPYPS